jgi:hypothetical protein
VHANGESSQNQRVGVNGFTFVLLFVVKDQWIDPPVEVIVYICFKVSPDSPVGALFRDPEDRDRRALNLSGSYRSLTCPAPSRR